MHQFLKKLPKRLAVVDQTNCSGCSGAPACASYCETVTMKKQVVDAIRLVTSPEGIYKMSVVEFDKCIGCGICVSICPWDAITMFGYEEAQEIATELTLAPYVEAPTEELATEEALQNP